MAETFVKLDTHEMKTSNRMNVIPSKAQRSRGIPLHDPMATPRDPSASRLRFATVWQALGMT